jgi:hypothetical protein
MATVELVISTRNALVPEVVRGAVACDRSQLRLHIIATHGVFGLGPFADPVASQ